MGKKDDRYGFINPLAAARSVRPAPSLSNSTEDYLRRPRISLDDAMNKLRSDKSTLEQWEVKMNEGFRQSLEKDRGKRLADSQAKATQKAAVRAKADVLERAVGMLRNSDGGTKIPANMTREKTLGKDKIPATTIIKTIKSTKVAAPLMPVIEMMSKGKLPTTTIVQAVKPSAKPVATGPSLADLDERTLRKALKRATSAVTSAGPTNSATADALASFEKELKRRKKEKKKTRKHKKKEKKKKKLSKRKRHISPGSVSSSSLSSSSMSSSSSSSSSVDTDSEAEKRLATGDVGDELNVASDGVRRLGRRSERSERKRKRRHRSTSSHSGSESDNDSDGSTSARPHRHRHRKHKKKKKHSSGSTRRHDRLDKPAPSDTVVVVSDDESGSQHGDEDVEEVWTEVTAVPMSAVPLPDAGSSTHQHAASSSRHHKHRSKRKRRRGQSDSDG